MESPMVIYAVLPAPHSLINCRAQDLHGKLIARAAALEEMTISHSQDLQAMRIVRTFLQPHRCPRASSSPRLTPPILPTSSGTPPPIIITCMTTAYHLETPISRSFW